MWHYGKIKKAFREVPRHLASRRNQKDPRCENFVDRNRRNSTQNTVLWPLMGPPTVRKTYHADFENLKIYDFLTQKWQKFDNFFDFLKTFTKSYTVQDNEFALRCADTFFRSKLEIFFMPNRFYQNQKINDYWKKIKIFAKLHAIYALQHHLLAVISLNSFSPTNCVR